jgi:hypothetical protein
MTVEEIKEEIMKLEMEAKQLLANANFINGALNAYHVMLAKVENTSRGTQE